MNEPTLRAFLERHQITPEHLLDISRRIERKTPADRLLAATRARVRRGPELGSYAEAGIAKPRSGRGLGRLRLGSALDGASLPPRPRAKLVRAVNVILAARGTTTVSSADIFGEPNPRLPEAAAAS